jgi:hypothetical protein
MIFDSIALIERDRSAVAQIASYVGAPFPLFGKSALDQLAEVQLPAPPVQVEVTAAPGAHGASAA